MRIQLRDLSARWPNDDRRHRSCSRGVRGALALGGAQSIEYGVRICKDWLAQQMWDEPGAAHAEIELLPVTCRMTPLSCRSDSPWWRKSARRRPLQGFRGGKRRTASWATSAPTLCASLHCGADPKCGGLAGWRFRRVKSAMEAAETSLSLEALATMGELSRLISAQRSDRVRAFRRAAGRCDCVLSAPRLCSPIRGSPSPRWRYLRVCEFLPLRHQFQAGDRYDPQHVPAQVDNRTADERNDRNECGAAAEPR